VGRGIPGRLRRGPAEVGGGGWRLPTTVRALLDLAGRMKEVEADRATLNTQVEQLTTWLRTSEADRRADVEELTRLFRESEADWAARLEVIHALQAQLEEIGRAWISRLYRTATSPATRGPRS
jgi:Asp-tRNA(Asn)/Glu-tRNA(Gln) amidotransferase C subunit